MRKLLSVLLVVATLTTALSALSCKEQTNDKQKDNVEQEEGPQYKSVELEGISIADYVIAINDEAHKEVAEKIAGVMGSFSDEQPKIVKYDELSDENLGVVCVGSNGRDPQNAWPEKLDGFFLNLEVEDEYATLSVFWTRDIYLEEAMTEFEKRFAVSGEGEVGEARFTSRIKTDIKNTTALTSTEWKVESVIERNVVDGLYQASYTCKGFRDTPYLIHVMIADLDKVDLMLGTADNRNDREDQWIQTPMEHALAAEMAGHTVYGAINAGYPTGISVKEGVQMVRGTIHRPYFAVLKTGEPVILYDDNAADVKSIELAACGTDVLVDNYMPTDIDMGLEFNYTTHPRTLIGIRGDGKVVMVVIDGRQPEIANGAPFTRCIDIMMRLGCKYALNLDGGGSSAMFVRKTVDGPFRTEIVNMISDPTMRKVRNSIMVVAKKEK